MVMFTNMAGKGKRDLPGVWAAPPASKAARVEEEGDSWQCEKCGNMNFASRTYCNMRKCGAPRDPEATSPQEAWICPSCSNENYGNRLFCNMRSCQAAKPGLSLKDLQGKGMAHLAVGPGGGAGNPPAWTCSCGNHNFPNRPICNSRKCGKPYPGTMGVYSMKGMGSVGTVKSAASQKPPEGSWVCNACQNVNWPTRDTCNAKACGLPRYQVDGGPSRATPAGSWVCPSCSNVNYPTRTECNRRSCGLPRPP